MKLSNLKYLDVLRINLILNYIKENPNITVTKIADSFRLSRQCANYILQKLLNENLVIISGYGCSTKKGGKKPKLFKFNNIVKTKYKRINFAIDIYSFEK